MNASSESGLWATWMVVIGGESLRRSSGRGERGVDVVLVQQVLGQTSRTLGRLRGEESRVERTCTRVAPLQARDARRENEPEQMRRPRREDGVRLSAGERGVAPDLAEPAQIVALVKVERADHFVCRAGHRQEGAHG